MYSSRSCLFINMINEAIEMTIHWIINILFWRNNLIIIISQMNSIIRTSCSLFIPEFVWQADYGSQRN